MAFPLPKPHIGKTKAIVMVRVLMMTLESSIGSPDLTLGSSLHQVITKCHRFRTECGSGSSWVLFDSGDHRSEGNKVCRVEWSQRLSG